MIELACAVTLLAFGAFTHCAVLTIRFRLDHGMFPKAAWHLIWIFICGVVVSISAWQLALS